MNAEIKAIETTKQKLEGALKTLKTLDSAIRLYFITKELFDGWFPGNTKDVIVSVLIDAANKHGASIQVVPGLIWVTYPDKDVQKEYTSKNYRNGGKVISRKVNGEWTKVKGSVI